VVVVGAIKQSIDIRPIVGRANGGQESTESTRARAAKKLVKGITERRLLE
jgi:hypothetical protein